jgi:hypothetical protein
MGWVSFPLPSPDVRHFDGYSTILILAGIKRGEI